MDFDLDAIQSSVDRSFSQALVHELQNTSLTNAQQDAIAHTLRVLDDPRSYEAFVALVEDQSAPARVRRLAADVLRSGFWTPPEELLLRWWNHGDEVLQSQALLSMGPEHASIIEEVASQPSHPLYPFAIDTMCFGFEQLHQQQLKIRALDHADPSVRIAGITTVLWDEPVVAELPLLKATWDSNEEVVEEAVNVLQYYQTQQVFRRVKELCAHPAEAVRKQAEDTMLCIRSDFLNIATNRREPVQKHIRRWLAPLWDELQFTAEELGPEEPYETPARVAVPEVSFEQLLEALDSEGKWGEHQQRFWRAKWERFENEARKVLSDRLVSHWDPFVREQSAKAFCAWNQKERLLALMKDPCFLVRKSAMYQLGQLSEPDETIASFAWEYLSSARVNTTHARETLATYLQHASLDDEKQVNARLFALAIDSHGQEQLRTTAIRELTTRVSAEAFSELLPLLQEPPSVSWAVVIAVLSGAADLGLKPSGLDVLLAVDHLYLQEALAPFVSEKT